MNFSFDPKKKKSTLKGGITNTKGGKIGEKRPFKGDKNDNKIYQNRGGQNSGDKSKTTDSKTHS